MAALLLIVDDALALRIHPRRRRLRGLRRGLRITEGEATPWTPARTRRRPGAEERLRVRVDALRHGGTARNSRGAGSRGTTPHSDSGPVTRKGVQDARQTPRVQQRRAAEAATARRTWSDGRANQNPYMASGGYWRRLGGSGGGGRPAPERRQRAGLVDAGAGHRRTMAERLAAQLT
ncbi:unnamed protein product [Miscanthus lutarioriparius]|uniref:Uncharacterized protein n=1 Tax=Miscanthus lutarioriparius TaxID=422564 RepID=A0A811Q2Z9_9POAL|nr:unnamed protein product [Miscanthus lutarioriparius]